MAYRSKVPDVGSTAPTDPQIDDLWVDTAGLVPLLKRFTDQDWVPVGAVSEGGVGGGAPTGPAGGDLRGTYPNPRLSTAKQAEIDAVEAAVAAFPLVDPDPALTANSDARIATQKATKAYGVSLYNSMGYAVGLIYATKATTDSITASVTANTNNITALLQSMRPKVVGDYQHMPTAGPFATGTLTLNRLIFIPVWLREGTIDRIGAEVTTLVPTAVGRFGIYGDNGTGKPGNLIAEAAGLQDLNVVGWATPQTISAVIPTMGRYYLAFVSQVAAGTVRVTTAGDPLASLLKGTAVPGASGTSLLTYHQTSVTGALPPTASGFGYTNNVCPLMVIRYAA